jgi:hypothetical protein
MFKMTFAMRKNTCLTVLGLIVTLFLCTFCGGADSFTPESTVSGISTEITNQSGTTTPVEPPAAENQNNDKGDCDDKNHSDHHGSKPHRW